MTSSFGGIHKFDLSPRTFGVYRPVSENHATANTKDPPGKTTSEIRKIKKLTASEALKEENNASTTLPPMDTLAQLAPVPDWPIMNVRDLEILWTSAYAQERPRNLKDFQSSAAQGKN
jgi:hypothetical protein